MLAGVMIEIEVENYRALRSARCKYEPGVTVVVGPNSAGKTTLLDVPALLRHAAQHGLKEALAHHGGIAARTWSVRGEDVRLQIRHERLRWELRFANDGDSLADLRERLWVGDGDEPYATQGVGEVMVSVGGEGFGLFGGGPAALPAARTKLSGMEQEFAVLDRAQMYSDYAVREVRVSGSVSSGSDTHLHPSGKNVFQVLRNWRDQPASRAQIEFVRSALRAAFPSFRDLAFQGVGSIVHGGFIFDRDLDRMEPALTAANGIIVGLLHLTAVAAAPRGGYVALDELENALHPFAIRSILDAIDERANSHGVAVVVSTHSPVVLDHFQSRPDRVLVAQPEDPRGFVPLTEVEDRDYLNDFSLGRMYGNGKFGAPKS